MPFNWLRDLDWSGQTVVLVGSGPSAQEAPLGLARDRAKVACVNTSWRLAPWADMLYAHSVYWWRAHQGVPEFKGLKVSLDADAKADFPEIDLAHCPIDPRRRHHKRLGDRYVMEMQFGEPGVIGWGMNGGFQCCNLIAQIRPKRIILVGIDATVANGEHWHGLHPGLKNPTERDTEVWRRNFDAAAPALQAQGIDVVNASPLSTLTAYRKMELAEALE